MKTLILIPARMASSRFPNKPMALIKGKPMIQRVWEQAIASDLGAVIVACCDPEVLKCIKSLGGRAIFTDPNLPSGTDRIYQALDKIDNSDQFDSIINLQGDMPIINPDDISKVNKPLLQGFDIGTLVTDLKKNQIEDINVTKVQVNWIKKETIGRAINFFKVSKATLNETYHHVGIYSFRYNVLKKFVSLSPSKNEIAHKLEQLRAIDAKMTVGVSYVKNVPISVDTKKDLILVESIMNQNYEKN